SVPRLQPMRDGRRWLASCHALRWGTERPLDHVGSQVQSRSPRDHLLEPASFFAVPGIAQDVLDQSLDPPYRESFQLQEFTDPVVCNTGRDTRLIISDGDRHHWHSLGERLEGRIQPGVRDAKRSTLQQFDLWRVLNDDDVRRNAAKVLALDI